MNERLVNIQLNFEHQPKKKIKLYRLEYTNLYLEVTKDQN